MVVPSNLDDRQILFSNEEDDEASHTASQKCHPVMRCGMAFFGFGKSIGRSDEFYAS